MYCKGLFDQKVLIQVYILDSCIIFNVLLCAFLTLIWKCSKLCSPVCLGVIQFGTVIWHQIMSILTGYR